MSRSDLDSNEVGVKDLNVQVGQRGADEVVLMENGTVLDLVFEVHEDCVLDELSLEETLLIDWTVEESLVAQVPEEIR